jgi:hypothetical protein
MIPSVFFGEGHKNWAIATPANKIFYSPDLVHDDHNVEESKKLLASLGFKDGNGDGVLEDKRGNPITFTLKTNSDNTLRIALANFLKDDLAKVGINVVLAPADFNTIITNIRADFQYEALLLGLQSGVPPDPAMMQNLYRSSGLTHFWNLTQSKPETPEEARIDELMDEIVTVRDVNARMKAYKEVETIVNQQAWFIWLPIVNQKVPVSNRFGNIQPTAPVVRSGRLRALAVTSASRSPILPDVPDFADAGLPGLEVSIHYGVLAPAATPPEIVARLNAALVKGLNTPETRKRIEGDGVELATSTPEEFARLIRTETDRWAKVIKAAGIMPE